MPGTSGGVLRIQGITHLTANLRKMAKLPKKDKKVMARLGILMLKSTDKTFQTEGQNLLGTKWTALKDETLARRRTGAGAGTPKILQDTGLLKQSIVYEIPEPLNVRWGPGTTAPYGKWHQLGTKHMTDRPFLGITKDDAEKLLDRLAKDLGRKINLEIQPGIAR